MRTCKIGIRHFSVPHIANKYQQKKTVLRKREHSDIESCVKCLDSINLYEKNEINKAYRPQKNKG